MILTSRLFELLHQFRLEVIIIDKNRFPFPKHIFMFFIFHCSYVFLQFINLLKLLISRLFYCDDGILHVVLKYFDDTRVNKGSNSLQLVKIALINILVVLYNFLVQSLKLLDVDFLSSFLEVQGVRINFNEMLIISMRNRELILDSPNVAAL